MVHFNLSLGQILEFFLIGNSILSVCRLAICDVCKTSHCCRGKEAINYILKVTLATPQPPHTDKEQSVWTSQQTSDGCLPAFPRGHLETELFRCQQVRQKQKQGKFFH